jgi:hypothetical protein
MSNPRILYGALGMGEADKTREWYKHANDAEFEAIIDHIRVSFPAHPDPVPAAIRAEAWRRVRGGDWDGMREYPDGARHYLVRDLSATVYVTPAATEYVDVHTGPLSVDAHWKAILAYGVVDKGGDRPKPASRMTGDAS